MFSKKNTVRVVWSKDIYKFNCTCTIVHTKHFPFFLTSTRLEIQCCHPKDVYWLRYLANDPPSIPTKKSFRISF